MDLMACKQMSPMRRDHSGLHMGPYRDPRNVSLDPNFAHRENAQKAKPVLSSRSPVNMGSQPFFVAEGTSNIVFKSITCSSWSAKSRVTPMPIGFQRF